MKSGAVPFDYVALEADAEVLCGALRAGGVRCNYAYRVPPLLQRAYLHETQPPYVIWVHEDDLARARELHPEAPVDVAMERARTPGVKILMAAAGLALAVYLVTKVL